MKERERERESNQSKMERKIEEDNTPEIALV